MRGVPVGFPFAEPFISMGPVGDFLDRVRRTPWSVGCATTVPHAFSRSTVGGCVPASVRFVDGVFFRPDLAMSRWAFRGGLPGHRAGRSSSVAGIP